MVLSIEHFCVTLDDDVIYENPSQVLYSLFQSGKSLWSCIITVSYEDAMTKRRLYS